MDYDTLVRGFFATFAVSLGACVVVSEPPRNGPPPPAYAPPRNGAPPPPAYAPPTPSASHVEYEGKHVPIIRGSNTFGHEQAGALRGIAFFIPEGTSKVPSFVGMTPVAAFYTNELNIAPRDFSEGFPGIHNRFEWFAVRYDGHFTTHVDGDYSFRDLSDDGSLVYVDNALVVSDDGVHPPREARGTVRLARGDHQIRVEYFQGPRFQVALQLWVTPPGGQERLWGPQL